MPPEKSTLVIGELDLLPRAAAGAAGAAAAPLPPLLLLLLLPELLRELVRDHLREAHRAHRVRALAVHAQPRSVHHLVAHAFHAFVRRRERPLARLAVVKRQMIPERMKPKTELRRDDRGGVRAHAAPRQPGASRRVRLGSRDDGRAEVDGDGERRGVRVHASADSVARFEDDDVVAVVRDHARGGEAGGAGADDDDLAVERRLQRRGSLRAARPLLFRGGRGVTVDDVVVTPRVLEKLRHDPAYHELLLREVDPQRVLHAVPDLPFRRRVHVRAAKKRNRLFENQVVLRDHRPRRGSLLRLLRLRLGDVHGPRDAHDVAPARDGAVVDPAVFAQPRVRVPREVRDVGGKRGEASVDGQRRRAVLVPHLQDVVSVSCCVWSSRGWVRG